jgi:nitrogen fixation/metabolism regulation signal transduction histidine kinase
MAKNFRGSGVRHTIHMVGRFSGLWLLVTIAAVTVATVSSYLLITTVMDGAVGNFVNALLLQAVLTVVAVLALAIFTTHRLGGPWIAVRRALEGVRDGDLDTQLRIRSGDPYLKDVERAFNEMTAVLRGGSRRDQSGAA